MLIVRIVLFYCFSLLIHAYSVNTPQTSASGNIHGMPVAFLLGLVERVKELPAFEWFEPCLQPKDIVYIGLRDLDLPEKNMVRKLGIKAFTVIIVCNIAGLT
jgi:arginase